MAPDDEPEVQSWGESKRQGGAVSWDDLADDLLDEVDAATEDAREAPTTGAPTPEEREAQARAIKASADQIAEALAAREAAAGQPAWARPNVAGFAEDLWPEDLVEPSHPTEAVSSPMGDADTPSESESSATRRGREPTPEEVAALTPEVVHDGARRTNRFKAGAEEDGFDVTRGRGGAASVPDDLWDDLPSVVHDKRVFAPEALDLGEIEVRRQTARGSERLTGSEEE